MINAESLFLNSKNEFIHIYKKFDKHSIAEKWVKNNLDNPNCVYSGCPTFAGVIKLDKFLAWLDLEKNE